MYKNVREVNIKSTNVSDVVDFKGIISAISEVKTRLKTGAFLCPRCSSVSTVDQDFGEVKEPDICFNCKKTAKALDFKLVTDESEFSDYQIMYVKDLETEESVAVKVDEEYTNSTIGDHLIGEKVRIKGVISLYNKDKHFDLYIEANEIEKKEGESDIEDELVEEFLEHTSFDDIRKTLISRKKSPVADLIVLSLFSNPNDPLNILISSKNNSISHVFQDLTKMVKPSIYISGELFNNTLIAETRNETFFGEEMSFVKGGDLSLSRFGIAVISNIDELEKTHLRTLSNSIRDGVCRIEMGLSNTRVLSGTPVLAFVNSEYENFQKFYDNINIPSDIKSNFDLFVKDSEYATTEDILYLDTLNEYISAAKLIEVELPPDLEDMIDDHSKELKEENISIPSNLKNTLIKLSKARARTAYSREVREKDVEECMILIDQIYR
ncbi:MAG: hypothetical protein ACOC5D_07620 [Thermoplasmatota archaeon]